jgi:hypothetical protein
VRAPGAPETNAARLFWRLSSPSSRWKSCAVCACSHPVAHSLNHGRYDLPPPAPTRWTATLSRYVPLKSTNDCVVSSTFRLSIQDAFE